MNPLNKLIQQYERENQGKKAIRRSRNISSPSYYTSEFVLWLASRPTCGLEQRKFLDEVEKEGEYVDDGRRFGKGIDIGKISAIYQFDTKADLQKVIKGE